MHLTNYTEIQNKINKIINDNSVNWKFISHTPDDLYLIELSDKKRIIVDLKNKTLHNTKTKDDGIMFDGTGYTITDLVTSKSLKTKPVKYLGEQLIQRIMEILKLSSSIGWSVIDYVDNLYLIHYDDNANMAVVGHLRGILVDIEAGIIVASSYGFTPSVKVDLLKDDNGKIDLTDSYGIVHNFNTDELVIKRVFEGVVLRVILYDGQVYRLTHKKIRPLKSRWGTSPYFTVMYKQAGGPVDTDLFDMSKKYSPWCFVFLVVHPKLLIATKQNVISPYIVLLSINEMYNVNNSPYKLEDVDIELHYKFKITKEITGTVNKQIIHQPQQLTVNEANYHLTYGYYNENVVNDARLLPGEAVILYKVDIDGNVKDIVKVNSVAYDYRFNLRGNNSNAYHRFFELINYSYKPISDSDDFRDFANRFIILENYTENQLHDLIKTNSYILSLNSSTLSTENKKNLLTVEAISEVNFLKSMKTMHITLSPK